MSQSPARKLITLVLACACTATAFAATVALDDAGDVAYNNPPTTPWATGDNGGTGWGSAWTISTVGDAQVGVDSSTLNGNGDQFPPGTGDGDIDVPRDFTDNGPAERAWYLTSTNSNVGTDLATATRLFDGGLLLNQSFRITLDTGTISALGEVGVILSAGGSERFRFTRTGDTAEYLATDGGTLAGIGRNQSDEGMEIVFTLTDWDTYEMTLDLLGNGVGVNTTIARTLSGTHGALIDRVTLFSLNVMPETLPNGQQADNYWLFASDMEVSPEPGTLALALLGGLGLAGRRRWR